jgi:glycerol kinase
VWGTPLKITALACDQPASVFGHCLFTPGSCKCTYGTGAFVEALTGDHPYTDRSPRLMTCIAWKLGPRPVYILDGGVFTAGAALEWCARITGRKTLPRTALNRVLRRVPHDLRPLCLPAFAGFGAPHWLPEAGGEFRNLTLGTTADDLLRATAQGIALRVRDILAVLRTEYGIVPEQLMVDGGLVRSPAFLRYQANVLGLPLAASTDVDVTARGCAMFAGIGAGIWTIGDLSRMTWPQRRILPDPTCAYAAQHTAQWERARDNFTERPA